MTINSITQLSGPGPTTVTVPDSVPMLQEIGTRPPTGENSLPSVDGQDVRTGASAHSPESEEGSLSVCSWNNLGLIVPLPHQAGESGVLHLGCLSDSLLIPIAGKVRRSSW